jgi:hypothetical protein
VGLIAGVIEQQGIPTVCISLEQSISEVVNPPRTLFVDRPFGYPLGAPHDPAVQRGILSQALDLLSRPAPILETATD